MNRPKSSNSTPQILKTPITLRPLGVTTALSQKDLSKLMMAKIISGMLSSNKYDKFELKDIISTAKDVVDKINNVI